jgi:hypothetical protein
MGSPTRPVSVPVSRGALLKALAVVRRESVSSSRLGHDHDRGSGALGLKRWDASPGPGGWLRPLGRRRSRCRQRRSHSGSEDGGKAGRGTNRPRVARRTGSQLAISPVRARPMERCEPHTAPTRGAGQRGPRRCKRFRGRGSLAGLRAWGRHPCASAPTRPTSLPPSGGGCEQRFPHVMTPKSREALATSVLVTID